MKWNTPEQILELTLDLVGQESISATRSEAVMGEKIYRHLQGLPYFQKHQENLFLEAVPKDPLGRNFVAALVEGQRKNTLIFIGHLDVVGIEDYGALKEWAFNPIEYTKRLNPDALPEDAKADLLSGKWLFGRGIMDMKSGIAMNMSLIEEYSEQDDFPGSIIFLVVPDEESNSAGLMAAVPFLNKLIAERGLRPIVAIDTEPNFPAYPGDNNRYIYFGTAGKLLPSFYFFGKEAHVGESLSGLNVNLLAGKFMELLDVNTDFSDEANGATIVPPTCLKYKDLKEEYNVQTPMAGVAYYNLLTLQTSPKAILEKLRGIGEEAFTSVLDKIEKERKKFEEKSGRPVQAQKFKHRVLTYDELYHLSLGAHGEKFKGHLSRQIEKWLEEPGIDERELCTRIVAETHRFCPDRNPMIVIYFSPPYYPHVGLRGEGETEQRILAAAEKVIAYAKENFDEEIFHQPYFQGISDLSFFALQDGEEVLNYLRPNIPSWGYRYSIPLEEIKKLNIPVINLGPHGRDAHKFTERIELKYSFEVVPKLQRLLVKNLLQP